MLIPDLAANLSSYNVRNIEEHAYRTTITIAKNKLLVLERKNEKFTLEVVDNSHNSWHTTEEWEFASEEAIIGAMHDYLQKTCGDTPQRKSKT